MKFVVSSTKLKTHLLEISRVISSKNTLPILDNFLFKLEGNTLEITASDLETTFITRLELENASEDGSIAIPARILNDTLKEFPEQPLSFNVNAETYSIAITSENGEFNIMGQDAEDFPELPKIEEEGEAQDLLLKPDMLLNGVGKTLFATAEDELRPVMNGIYIEIASNEITFVASDSHKLVRYRRSDLESTIDSNFVLPKKPASLLKNVLPKQEDEVKLRFNEKNAIFDLSNYSVICRLAEGKYPSYDAVIPPESPFQAIIDRVVLANSLKRVSVFSNQASNLVKFELKPNEITISAQDLDFSISAYEKLACQYDGDDMEIGFKSIFLIEILQNITSADVRIELADSSRAGLFLPVENENENEDELMLLMPMMVDEEEETEEETQ